MSDAKSAELLRNVWKWGALLTGFTVPLLKFCDFATGHRLVTLEPGMSNDPFTLLINLFYMTALVSLGTLIGAVFACFF